MQRQEQLQGDKDGQWRQQRGNEYKGERQSDRSGRGRATSVIVEKPLLFQEIGRASCRERVSSPV